MSPSITEISNSSHEICAAQSHAGSSKGVTSPHKFYETVSSPTPVGTEGFEKQPLCEVKRVVDKPIVRVIVLPKIF